MERHKLSEACASRGARACRIARGLGRAWSGRIRRGVGTCGARWLACALPLLLAAGCAAAPTFQPLPALPSELNTVPQPPYVVAPPDRLFIHVQVAAKPAPEDYDIQPGDVLSLEVATAPGPGQLPSFASPQILVAPDGKIRIGQYGELKVAGRNLEEIERELKRLLKQHPDFRAVAPRIALQLAFLHDSIELLTGDRLVRPDGTLNLSPYGDVFVQGLTLPQVRESVRKQILEKRPDLVPRLESSDELYIDVEVTGFNSQVVYVQQEVTAPQILPLTGKETVLDAIVRAGSATELAERNDVYLVRVDPFDESAETMILPVYLRDIIEQGDTATNYQLRPGDRIVVPPRHIIALQRFAAPFLQFADSIATTGLLYQQLIFNFIRGPNPVSRSQTVPIGS